MNERVTLRRSVKDSVDTERFNFSPAGWAYASVRSDIWASLEDSVWVFLVRASVSDSVSDSAWNSIKNKQL